MPARHSKICYSILIFLLFFSWLQQVSDAGIFDLVGRVIASQEALYLLRAGRKFPSSVQKSVRSVGDSISKPKKEHSLLDWTAVLDGKLEPLGRTSDVTDFLYLSWHPNRLRESKQAVCFAKGGGCNLPANASLLCDRD